MKVRTSKRFAVNLLDIAKGFLVAAITAIVVTCGQIFEVWMTSPTFSINKVDLVMVLKVGIGGGIAYLIKNFFSPAKTVITESTPEDESKIVDTINGK